MIRLRRSHAIIALGLDMQLDDIGCGMPAGTLGTTHDRTTSSVASHYRPWTAHTVRGSRAFHAIHTLGVNTKSHDVKRDMLSSLFKSTHGLTMSSVACPYGLWTTHSQTKSTWHAIIAIVLHTDTNDVRRGMPSSPLSSTNGRKTSGVRCHYLPCTAHKDG